MLKEIIVNDIKLVPSSRDLWNVDDLDPYIKQIYGHFLSPQHMQYVSGLIAKDFNFPAAYHKPQKEYLLSELVEKYVASLNGAEISIKKDVSIRLEDNGGVIYTAYHNGYFTNLIGASILENLKLDTTLQVIRGKYSGLKKGLDHFIAKLFILDIIDLRNASC